VELNDDKEYNEAAKYITKLTMSSVADLFSQAHMIKSWLIECASISAQNNQPISWVTPLGFPICQPYYDKPKFEKIKTMKITADINVDSDRKSLLISKQKTAFPPNFVHR
jgi:DNA-directed RNA polymerase